MKEETREMMHFAVALDELSERVGEIKKLVDIKINALEKENSELNESWKYAEEQWGLWEQKAKQCADDTRIADKLKLLHELYERDVAKLPEEMSVLFNELYSNLVSEMRRNMIVMENAGIEKQVAKYSNECEFEEEAFDNNNLFSLQKGFDDTILKFRRDVLASLIEENDKVAGYIEKSLVFNLRDIKDGLNKNINKVIEKDKETLLTLNSKIDRMYDGFMSEMFEAIEGVKNYWFMGTMAFLLLANLVLTAISLLKK